MSRTFRLFITLSLASCGITGCADPERTARSEATPEDDGGMSTVELSSEDVVAEAMGFEDNLTRLSEMAEQSETHADAASVFVWGTPSVADLYLSIDPDDPTQSVDFPQGTMFVKEHFDEAGDREGLTVMYKGPPGYNPDSRDWFWARVRGEETTHAGRVEWCSDCHNAAHNSDFVVGFGKSP